MLERPHRLSLQPETKGTVAADLTTGICSDITQVHEAVAIVSVRQLYTGYVGCAGNCSSSKISSGRLLLEEGSELQLRLEFSSGPPCYCISLGDKFTFSMGFSVK